ncbi:putative MATE family efflux protein [Parabacteroides sp. PF5-5]|nr:putative MATE family efflux protein [Parabacteroides sp. PH5-39]MDH6316356.1 putative MATE family efflux protein [Parabacteroides sp. PF5-13]MDH6319839.1 putative MATE family efflux protein [Parabacteroides sp. PH5-13]MDH6323570.1 putative MATE family efflux protein [Parabacteroides sp. PH5-8]MDH6327543.1 putative MATE family efflux protein [Parabacteroides sp. PH5-41]MDH6335317.1 putative MATE family efflux protein [Parabacteroides sp. PF5-5]MDH6346380.1 putative MATE family efflux protei
MGEVELGASALGGIFYICCFTIAFGFSTGSQILIARRNGERAYDQVGPVMIQGVFFLFALAIVLYSFTRIFSTDILQVLISSDTILEATASFLNIRMAGLFFSYINVMFRALFVGITRTKVLTLNAVLMAVTNIILDYLLIFGHGGFPEMGLEGAAIASVAAEAVSIVFFVTYTFLTVDLKKYGLNKLVSFDFKLLKRILDISIFTMLQYFVSMSTFLLFFLAVERIGQSELAVANIVRSIYIVMFIPVNSLSTTTNSLVSNLIGAGNTNQVIPIIRKIARFSLAIMAVCSAIICLIPEYIASIYTNDAFLIASSIPSIYVIAGAMLLSAVSNICFNGVSGTGNTRPALLMELLTLVFYCIYIYVIGMRLKMPVHVCFTSELIYYGLLFIFSALYLKSGKWQNKKI